MNWIEPNYKWLFGGVFGAAVVAVVWFLNRLFSGSKRQVVKTANDASHRDTSVVGSPVACASHVRDFHPDPAPENISDRINGALPSHRNAMAENVRGLSVRWQARLTGAAAVEVSVDIYDLTFKPETKGGQQSIKCRANISANPRLKIRDRNELWEVCGFIEEVAMAGSIIDLRDVQISYVGPIR
ncbi:MAG: hypothetical protein ACRD4Q_08605 [Candidatus Acidiferrales bacterium]